MTYGKRPKQDRPDVQDWMFLLLIALAMILAYHMATA